MKKPSSVNALSGLYLISTIKFKILDIVILICVNALSGLYLISTDKKMKDLIYSIASVNALSGLYLISTGFIWQSNGLR